MRTTIFSLVLVTMASPICAQEQIEEIEVIPADGANAHIVVRRSLRIPDEIAFAITPYGMCLDAQRQARSESGTSIIDAPDEVPQIIENCRAERDEAIFMASTALERSTAMGIEARRAMIFETLKSVEGLILNTEPPNLEKFRSDRD